MTKDKIPKALREQVWIHHFGNNFQVKCPINWCQNRIDVFNFECGHNKPESKGGKTDLNNLIPICGRCNKSMSNNYTIDEWNKIDEKFTVDEIEKSKSKNKKKGDWKKEKKVLKKESWRCCGLF